MKKIKNIFIQLDARLEVRALDDGTRELTGFIPYNSKSEDMGFYEILNPGCFKKTISENKRIVALWNHDSSMVLGSTRNQSLSFEDTKDGLIIHCKLLADTSWARDALANIECGNVNTMSFGFYSIRESLDDVTSTRTILEAKLTEVSFGVPFPCYEQTDSEARSMILEKRNIDLEKLEETLTAETIDENQIRSTIDALTALLPIHDEPLQAPIAEPDKVAKLKELDLMLFDIDHQI